MRVKKGVAQPIQTTRKTDFGGRNHRSYRQEDAETDTSRILTAQRCNTRPCTQHLWSRDSVEPLEHWVAVTERQVQFPGGTERTRGRLGTASFAVRMRNNQAMQGNGLEERLKVSSVRSGTLSLVSAAPIPRPYNSGWQCSE